MDNLEFTLKVPVDSQGFIEYECPHCESIFRLDKNLFSDSGNYIQLWCPYCGLSSPIEKFYTSDVVEYSRVLAEEIALESLEKSFKKNGLFQFKSSSKKKTIRELKLHIDIDLLKTCNSCNENYKIKTGSAVSYCPYCGGIK